MSRVLLLIICLAFPLEAATLQGKIYLALPWGTGPGQIGRYMPSKGEDAQIGGPCAFAVDAQGNIYIADVQSNRLQVYDQRGHVLRDIHYDKRDSANLVWGVDISRSGEMYVLVNFSSRHKRDHSVLVYGKGQKVLKKYSLTHQGIFLPLHIQLGDHDDWFVGDNKDFQTFHMTLSGRILEKKTDERIFWLRTKGLYNYTWDKQRVTVLSSLGRHLAEYEGRVELLGVDPAGNLYTLYKKGNQTGERPDVWVTGLTAEGRELFRIHVTNEKDDRILDPDLFDEIRNALIGPDGAIYVMGDPQTEDQFRIYRYVIKP